MNNRATIIPRMTQTFALIAALVLSISVLYAVDASPEKPNIVVIYTDDQGYGDMSALDPESKCQTPNMDRIAQEGMIFTEGHSAAAVCSPSRYALLMGRYAWRTSMKSGVLGSDGPCLIAQDRITLASLLKAKGYQTAIVGKWHLNMEFPGTRGERDWSKPITDGPTEHGFDYYFGIPASMNFGVLTFVENTRVLDVPSMWTHKKKDKPSESFRFMPPYDSEPKSKGDIEIAPSFRDDLCLGTLTEKAVDYINSHVESAKAGQPFFLYFAMTSPHLPLCPAPEFIGKSQVGRYGDFMLETDHRVGQILAALDKNGLAENTLVVFSSDNGSTGVRGRLNKYGHASSGGFKGQKQDIYEGGHHVPFLMRWPGVIQPGRTCDETVCQVDLFATVADIVGAKLPTNAGEDSYSLLAALRGEEYPHPLRGPLVNHSGGGYFAIRDGQWKLDFVLGAGTIGAKPVKSKPGEPPFELYNMKDDWRETTNVYGQYPEVVTRLEGLATKTVMDGRSTPGVAQKNDGEPFWPQLTWIPEAAALPKTKEKRNNEE